MKKLHGFSSTAVAIIIVAVVFVVITGIVISSNLNGVHYENYDFAAYIDGSADNGFIADHIKGDKDAPVKIVEYADYQCPLCASVNPKINEAVESSDGKLAVIYRNFLLSYHLNATAAASAAEAAGLQGYWKPYADLLFKNQADWEYATSTERTALFKQYFEEASDGAGDLEKFEADLSDLNIQKKISFDMGIARRIDAPGTPSLYVDGTYIDWTNSDGAEIVVNSRLITWDSAVTLDGLPGLLVKIAEAKLEE